MVASRLTAQAKDEMRRLFWTRRRGVSELAEQFGVVVSTVSRVVNWRVWDSSTGRWVECEEIKS